MASTVVVCCNQRRRPEKRENARRSGAQCCWARGLENKAYIKLNPPAHARASVQDLTKRSRGSALRLPRRDTSMSPMGRHPGLIVVRSWHRWPVTARTAMARPGSTQRDDKEESGGSDNLLFSPPGIYGDAHAFSDENDPQRPVQNSDTARACEPVERELSATVNFR